MSTPSLPDINVWLALSLQVHPLHHTALEWFEGAAAGSVHFCRFTQQGTLRLLTTEALTAPLGLKPLSNIAAIRSMTTMLEDERIVFAEEPKDLFRIWMRSAEHRAPSPKLWMDSYLAAFALAGGYSLVTNDKGFKQFNGLRLELLK